MIANGGHRIGCDLQLMGTVKRLWICVLELRQGPNAHEDLFKYAVRRIPLSLSPLQRYQSFG